MSLPRFYVPELPMTGSVSLDQQEARHASQVLRLAVGDAVELFDGRGGSAAGTISQVSKRGMDVQVVERTDVDRELPRSIELLVALPKGDRQKQLIDSLVQLGVHRLTPLATRRSVAQPVAAAIDRLTRGVIESSKQCGRNRLLEIGQPTTLDSLLLGQPESASSELLSIDESVAEGRAGRAGRANGLLRCFAHPYGNSQALAFMAALEPASVQFLVGPEGGLTDEEADALVAAGWLQVSLGARILRVEMAATAIAAWWSVHTSATTSDRISG